MKGMFKGGKKKPMSYGGKGGSKGAASGAPPAPSGSSAVKVC